MAGVDSFSRFRDFVARPLGGGGEVRCQGSSRAAAGGGGGEVRGGGRRRYLAMRPLKWKFPPRWRLFIAVVIMQHYLLPKCL